MPGWGDANSQPQELKPCQGEGDVGGDGPDAVELVLGLVNLEEDEPAACHAPVGRGLSHAPGF